MTIKELSENLNLKIFTGDIALEREVCGGYTSDLLSDVMGFASEGQIWVTLQTHKNIIGIASLKDLAGIIIVKGFEPDEDTVAAAVSEEIPILGTDIQTFELSGKLYNLLK